MTDRTTTSGAGIRGFRAGDGPQLVEAWRRSAPTDPITRDRFRSLVLLDANFDPQGLRVAVDGDRVVGAAHAVRRLTPMTGTDLEPEQGWIPFFFVAPAARGRGLGRRLLTDALGWLHSHGRTRVDFSSYTPNYILPGLDAEAYPEAAGLLESLDFRTLYEAAAMDRGLIGFRLPEDVALRLDELTRGATGSPPRPTTTWWTWSRSPGTTSTRTVVATGRTSSGPLPKERGPLTHPGRTQRSGQPSSDVITCLIRV
ncbi:GNAT family N-acetyltransferase [Streptomyces sp. NPDC001982]|uniref:GNAT family N-acetyltransferase n=1 Tax=Streptomyces sp. NPDC001982 TaxID=3154405 RepID=UPI00331CB979